MLEVGADIADWIDGRGDAAEPEEMRRQIDALADAARSEPVEASDAIPSISYEIITSAELDSSTFEQTYLIDRTLVKGQPAIIAGPKKSLKTTILIAIAIALATGRALFAELTVNKLCRVLVMSGESGWATIQETARRIAVSMDLTLAGIDGLLWSSDLPKFGNAEYLAALEHTIQEQSLDVLVLDPAYLCMDGADAGNLFVQGELLRGMNEVCQRNNVTLILVHHTRKGGKIDPFSPPELEDISWAGFQEWARQWILVGRRERYEPGTGEHRLWLNVGGSAGHSALWCLDVSEGDSDSGEPRTFDAKLLRAHEGRQDAADRRQQDKAVKAAERLYRDKQSILDAILACPQKAGTQKEIRTRAGISGTTFGRAFADLMNDGDIVSGGEEIKGNGHSYEVFRLPEMVQA